MKRNLFIFYLLFLVSVANSQIITNVNIQSIDCNNDTGYIAIETDLFANFYLWEILDPNLIILDETDSGLDIDALKTIADGVNSSRSKDKSFLVITHYQRLLDYIKPDFVHVLSSGKIIKSGSSELALELEKKGYKKIN